MRLRAALLGAAIVLFGLPASAEIVVGLERAFGLTYISTSQPGPQNSTLTQRRTGFGLGATHGDDTFQTVRVGVDWVAPARFTIGGALGFSSRGGENEAEGENATITTDVDSTSRMVFAVRGGYWIDISPLFVIWPRGGFSYEGESWTAADDDDDSKWSTWALTVEVPLIWRPVPPLGFSLTPLLDIGLSRNYEVNGDDADGDYSLTNTGLMLGMCGIF
jgi:hypothetical protein